ncbi:MAG: YncE family protein [Planctomycetota bacterium]|jgi:DNA-binding beta-propeller fold protein YncE
MRCTSRVLASLLCASVLSIGTRAQGEFVNFEIQPIKPMALAQVDGREFLLVCNTPDNSVEIYDTSNHSFVQRVPVGLRPVSVYWRPLLRQFYTVNFLGDSVTAVDMLPDLSNGANQVARVHRSMPVGDEPTDLLFLPGDWSFFVTLNSQSAMGWFTSRAIYDILGGLLFPLTFPLLNPDADIALKEPRRIIMNGVNLTVMGHKGGNDPATYDHDIYTLNFANARQMAIKGLGSSNFNLEAAKDGRLFVVGTMARNDLIGEPMVSQAPTGFVESHLYVVENPGAFVIDDRISDRNLNLDAAGGIVPKDLGISGPTDLALLQRNDVEKVFVTGFHSDRIIVLHNNGGSIDHWPAKYIDLPNGRRGEGYGRVGPRSLLLAQGGAVAGSIPQVIRLPRLYSFNSLNHTVSIIDPIGESEIGRFRLANDPTTRLIRKGREFLYSADISGSGFVSCASCHVDGKTDNMSWNLGIPGNGILGPIPELLPDGAEGLPANANFDEDKGPLFTQSLQGLVEHPVFSQAQWLMTTAPYHWRGDKPGLQDFNSAFVNLMSAPNVGTPEEPKGLSDEEMGEYEAMLQSIMYPPNPAQPKDRRFAGNFGHPDLEDGSGALRGLKLYHTRPYPAPITLGRSCVQCHALPDGSNSRITELVIEPIETPGMRGFLQKEAKLESGPFSNSIVRTGEFGLAHTGLGGLSMNGFLRQFFTGFFIGEMDKLFDIIDFSRQLDWGVAPLVGAVVTINRAVSTTDTSRLSFKLAESQVHEANVGLAIHARLAGRDRGFYYDITVDPPAYREEGTDILLSRAELLARMVTASDQLILQVTEAGSERRVASLTGVPTPLQYPVPSSIDLLPMRPGTAWRNVPSLRKNWNKGTGPMDFVWTGGVNTPEPNSLKAMRIFQLALINKAPQFGLTTQRHDPPRRFRVAGKGIRLGASLGLLIPGNVDSPPPYPDWSDTQTLAVKLFPTDEHTQDGRQIWESAAEIDQLMTYGLLLGGPWAPDVVEAALGNVPEPPPVTAFDPLGWNLYHVTVMNEDGTFAHAGWQRLRIE